MNNLVPDYFSKLGFSTETTKILLALVQFGPLTMLEAARKTGIERTKLYRLSKELIGKGLVEEIPGYKQTTIKAIDAASLEQMVHQKQAEANFLSSSFSEFANTLASMKNTSPGSNVVYYRGKEGMKQLVWHMLRCQEMPFRTYSCAFWADLFGDKFSLDLNEELLAKKFKVHDLYSDTYIKYKNEWNDKNGAPPGNWNFWHSRFISEKILKIQMNMDVYDNVVSYYYWENDQLFGVEITDEKVALHHKQVFDILWKMARPMPHFNWRKPDKTWRQSNASHN